MNWSPRSKASRYLASCVTRCPRARRRSSVYVALLSNVLLRRQVLSESDAGTLAFVLLLDSEGASDRGFVASYAFHHPPLAFCQLTMLSRICRPSGELNHSSGWLTCLDRSISAARAVCASSGTSSNATARAREGEARILISSAFPKWARRRA